LWRDGVTADELNKARQGYLESLKVSRSSDVAIAGTLAGLRHLDRTMTRQAELERKIQALTPESVSAAWRAHVDPNRLVVVAAGVILQRLFAGKFHDDEVRLVRLVLDRARPDVEHTRILRRQFVRAVDRRLDVLRLGVRLEVDGHDVNHRFG